MVSSFATDASVRDFGIDDLNALRGKDFFRGRDRDYVAKVLHGCGFEALIAPKIIVERCLVTVEHRRIQMHELLGVMGTDIVY